MWLLKAFILCWIACGYAQVFLLNDADLFDQNELSLIKLLFQPHSDLYQEISSLELFSILDGYTALKAINHFYVVPPSTNQSNRLFSNRMQTLLSIFNDLHGDALCKQTELYLLFSFVCILFL